jgi:UDP-N-acetylglucosamine--N-acetylmuramyl-(pentapeptide) pyrophosphoryl-undecaprenol N-acetylglucosamine transferase
MKLVIAAGGTGGHVYPAVALAREAMRQEADTQVLFVGTTRGIESKVVPREGFDLRLITALPVMGMGPWAVLRAMLAMPVGLWQAIAILRERRPDVVISIGGYTSPPVVMAAWLLRLPLALVEPNACPGQANRMLAPLATRIFAAFETARAYFPAGKVRIVGTPIRREFVEESEGETSSLVTRHSSPESGRMTLLAFGGSQGAHAINQAMIEAAPLLRRQSAPLRIVHQTGEADRAAVAAAYERAGFGADEARVEPYLYDMPAVVRGADLVVARAGAVSVAELTACGKPAILIPLPHAIAGHQEHNARALEAAGAAVVVRQHELTGSRLAETVGRLLADRVRLSRMGECSRALGRPDSAAAIIAQCRALKGGEHEDSRADGVAGA